MMKNMSEITSITNNKELTKRLKALGLTNRQFADLIGYSTHAFKKWQDETPKWVTFVIAYLEAIKKDEKIASELGIASCLKSNQMIKKINLD